MENIINEQLNLVLEEIELISDTYQRADIRVKLISALTGIGIDNSEPVGKEAFKNDVVKEESKPKETKDSKKKDAKKETKASKKKEDKKVETKEVDEQPIIFEKATPDVVEDPKPKEIDLEGPAEPEVQEPIVIECTDDDGNAYELDITDAWLIVGDEEGSEERVELAKNLTEYNLLPIYTTFDKLEDSYSKMMLSYYLQEFSLQSVNEFVDSLTDGQFKDVYEFVNNKNIEGLIANIEEATSEE